MGQAQQVERRGLQTGHLLNLPAAHVPGFGQTAGLFHPAEHLLDLLPRSLAERVAPGLQALQHTAARAFLIRYSWRREGC
jgi:hypothetical protein